VLMGFPKASRGGRGGNLSKKRGGGCTTNREKKGSILVSTNFPIECGPAHSPLKLQGGIYEKTKRKVQIRSIFFGVWGGGGEGRFTLKQEGTTYKTLSLNKLKVEACRTTHRGRGNHYRKKKEGGGPNHRTSFPGTLSTA